MRQEEDYIKREIEKILSFIKDLISKITSNTGSDASNLDKNNENFITYFGISLSDLTVMNASDFDNLIIKIDSKVLEKLLKLFYEICKRETNTNRRNSLVEKSITLIECIDDKEKTFSLVRMQIKKELGKK